MKEKGIFRALGPINDQMKLSKHFDIVQIFCTMTLAKFYLKDYLDLGKS